MNREPDWEALDEINFAIHRRMVEHLNAALAAISLINSADPAETTPEFWQKRALNEVLTALNTHNAWASLVRHKLGESFLTQHVRQFYAGELLTWVAVQLQIGNISLPKNDLLMSGNRETLQEALLLLYSCASVLGPGVRLMAQIEPGGIWFRVRYSALKPPPASLDALLESLIANWRSQNAAFELKRARDFLAMNQCHLIYRSDAEHGEFAFFVSALTRQAPAEKKQSAASANSQPRTIFGALEDRLKTVLVRHRDNDRSSGSAALRRLAAIAKSSDTTLASALRLLKKSITTLN